MEETNEQTNEQATENTGARDKPQVYDKIDNANLAAKRMEDAAKQLKEQNDRTERLLMETKLSGKSEAGIKAEKPKPMSEVEYAEAMQRGEVDPLRDDGITK